MVYFTHLPESAKTLAQRFSNFSIYTRFTWRICWTINSGVPSPQPDSVGMWSGTRTCIPSKLLAVVCIPGLSNTGLRTHWLPLSSSAWMAIILYFRFLYILNPRSILLQYKHYLFIRFRLAYMVALHSSCISGFPYRIIFHLPKEYRLVFLSISLLVTVFFFSFSCLWVFLFYLHN